MEAIPHKYPDYVVAEHSVIVNKGRIVRYRPRFDQWELDFVLELHDDQLPVSVVKEILDYAGLYVGIGDWRPQKAGKYGKFMVTKFEMAE